MIGLFVVGVSVLFVHGDVRCQWKEKIGPMRQWRVLSSSRVMRERDHGVLVLLSSLESDFVCTHLDLSLSLSRVVFFTCAQGNWNGVLT